MRYINRIRVPKSIKFFKLQQQPTQGDWVSTCQKDLKQLNISETLEEIKIMPKRTLKNMLQKRIQENAFNYLLKKRGSKGILVELKNVFVELQDTCPMFTRENSLIEKKLI